MVIFMWGLHATEWFSLEAGEEGVVALRVAMVGLKLLFSTISSFYLC
jgi:hypothetical protein